MTLNQRQADAHSSAAQSPAVPPVTVPVAFSVLDAAALLDMVTRVYVIAQPVTCALFRAWTNDVYRVQTSDATYFLKVYRYGWRSATEIAYELDVLAHMAARDVAVALPICRRDGQLIGTVSTPEGTRHYVLYSAAPGEKPRRPFDAALYHRFGQATARLHGAGDDFSSRHARTPLDLAYFFDAPLAALHPHLAHRPDDRAYLVDLADRVRARLAALAAAGLARGVCHGDLSLDNVHLAPDGRLVFYDFDSGGPGWPASDLYGVLQWAVLNRNDFWEAFLAGYRTVRRFGPTDVTAVRLFVVAQTVWSMGQEARHWARWVGLARVDDGYFDRAFDGLQRWDADQLTEQHA